MPTNLSTFKRGHVPELDGMRAAAITAVMLCHAGTPFFKGGMIGVDIFFVLSGFLITALLVREYDRHGAISLKRFYMRRALRLAPALILLLLTVVALSFLFFEADRARSNLMDALITLFYSANWARALEWHKFDFLGHTWSLSIEEQFYILWPIAILLLLRNMKSRWNIVLLVTCLTFAAWALRMYLLVNGASVERVYNGLDTRADALLMGCALAIVLESNLLTVRWQQVVSRALKYLAPLSVVGLLLIGYTMHWRNPHLYYWVLFLVEILTAVLILDVFMSERSLLRPILRLKFLVWLGGISYGLYLWHYPVYRVMRAWGFGGLGKITIGSLIALGIASLSYYLLELRFLRLKSRFAGQTPTKALDAGAVPASSV